MISITKDIGEVIPMFKEYMEYMSRFSDIDDYYSWYSSRIKYLDLYASEDDRFIYTLKLSGNIIGFAFVNKYLQFSSSGFAIAEFYIRKEHAGKSYGRQLAEYVFSQFIGEWEVAVILQNESAQIFWRKVIKSYMNGEFIEAQSSSNDKIAFLFNNTKKG